MYNYIAIEGTIGAGKTSLAQMLSADINTRLILEQFEENDFLPKFYKDPAKYAFPLELSFLASRFQQLKTELSVTDLFRNIIISDYFISKSLIFSRATLQEDEFNLYSKLFNIINLSLPGPDLIVYLYASVTRLKSNIILRGRAYEQNIENAYLQRIQDGYFEYLRKLSDMRIVIVDTNKLDFVNNKNHYEWMKTIIFKEYDPGIHTIVFEQ
ncbi:MAG TPA: deoxynucleoside kinase [Lentimicrobium sp.]|nr:deoxynucleoside kinase [Lentimicrobium sp.]